MDDGDHNHLIERVTKGFGALLEQVQDLAAKNDALDQHLSQNSAEVSLNILIQGFSCFSYDEIL